MRAGNPTSETEKQNATETVAFFIIWSGRQGELGFHVINCSCAIAQGLLLPDEHFDRNQIFRISQQNCVSVKKRTLETEILCPLRECLVVKNWDKLV